MTDREKLLQLFGDAEYKNDITIEPVAGSRLAEYLLANGVTFATDTNDGCKWISVEDEEKPKHLHEYFITYKFGNSDMRFYGAAKYYAFGGNGYVDRPHFAHEGTDGMYVTHWMEIPKLPKEDNDG